MLPASGSYVKPEAPVSAILSEYGLGVASICENFIPAEAAGPMKRDESDTVRIAGQIMGLNTFLTFRMVVQ
jgi:hypothetical protein